MLADRTGSWLNQRERREHEKCRFQSGPTGFPRSVRRWRCRRAGCELRRARGGGGAVSRAQESAPHCSSRAVLPAKPSSSSGHGPAGFHLANAQLTLSPPRASCLGASGRLCRATGRLPATWSTSAASPVSTPPCRAFGRPERAHASADHGKATGAECRVPTLKSSLQPVRTARQRQAEEAKTEVSKTSWPRRCKPRQDTRDLRETKSRNFHWIPKEA